MKRAYTRSRVNRAPDGVGGFTETLANSITVWGAMSVYDGVETLVVDAYEDVQVGDVIYVEEPIHG